MPCDLLLDCTTLCECYGACGASQACVCSACSALSRDATQDTQFLDIQSVSQSVSQQVVQTYLHVWGASALR